MAQGAAITWWIKAIDGCTVKDLHRHWSFANSVYDSVTGIKFFNALTLASLASVIVSVNNPIFQRASTVSVQPFEKNITMTVAVAQDLPEGYTSMFTGKTVPVLSGMSTAFQEVLRAYSLREPMHLNDSGCGTGNCSGIIKAAGLAVNCTKTSLPYDFGSALIGEHGHVVGSDYNGTVVGMVDVDRETFSSNFTIDMATSASINFTVAYKDQSPCKSRLVVNHCVLEPATLKYPVSIEDGVVRFTPPSLLSSLGSDPKNVVSIYQPRPYFIARSALGGPYLAASDLYTSHATISQHNHVWTLNISGTLAQDYATSLDDLVACENTWSDPTDEVISSLQEIMFRTALSVSNNPPQNSSYTSNISYVNTTQTIHTVQVTSQPAFQTHTGYLAAGVAVMTTCVVAVASTFRGWWKLGRQMSLSPIEIAKAFNAPLLVQGKATNCDLGGLLGFVGDRPVRYGEVRCTRGVSGGDGEEGGRFEEEEEEETVPLLKLEMAHPDSTTLPRKGIKYE